jgi:hypothetical protein
VLEVVVLELSSAAAQLLNPNQRLVINISSVPEWWNGKRAGLKINKISHFYFPQGCFGATTQRTCVPLV